MNVATTINKETLALIAAESIAKLNPADKTEKRWINAIAKAIVELESNPYLTFDRETHSLLICSSKSGKVYTANGTCQCEAHRQGQPCWHRAAARLVMIYVEREEAAAQAAKLARESRTAQDEALYYQVASTRPVEKIGSIRI